MRRRFAPHLEELEGRDLLSRSGIGFQYLLQPMASPAGPEVGPTATLASTNPAADHAAEIDSGNPPPQPAATTSSSHVP
jgi:hypothetical protein